MWITLGWLDDDAPSVVADLPALESLQLYGGSFTRHGLRQLGRPDRPMTPAGVDQLRGMLPHIRVR